jgi:hypothetical protein
MLQHLEESFTAVGSEASIDLTRPDTVGQQLSDISAQIVLDPPERNRFAPIEFVVLQQIGPAGKDIGLQRDYDSFLDSYRSFLCILWQKIVLGLFRYLQFSIPARPG